MFYLQIWTWFCSTGSQQLFWALIGYLPPLLKLVFALFFLGHDCGSLIFLTPGASALPAFTDSPLPSPALTSRRSEAVSTRAMLGVHHGGFFHSPGAGCNFFSLDEDENNRLCNPHPGKMNSQGSRRPEDFHPHIKINFPPWQWLLNTSVHSSVLLIPWGISCAEPNLVIAIWSDTKRALFSFWTLLCN